MQLHEAEKERDDYHTQLQLKLEELEKRDSEFCIISLMSNPSFQLTV